MLAIAVVCLVIFASLPTVAAFKLKVGFFELAGLAYFVGFGSITYLSFLSNAFLQLPVSFTTLGGILIFWMIFGILMFFITYRHAQLRLHLQSIKWNVYRRSSLVRLALLGVMFLPTLVSISANFYWPVRDWDALSMYDYRALVIKDTREIAPLSSQYANYYFAYPLYTSLVHVVFYLLGSTSAMPFYGFNLLFFQILIFSLLSRRARVSIAGIATFFIGLSYPVISNSLMAYTNLPYSIFIIVSILYGLEAIHMKEIKRYGLSLMLMGFGLWTRNAEPFWMITILLPFLSQKRCFIFQSLLVAGVVFFAFYYPWSFYISHVIQVPVSPSAVDLSTSLRALNMASMLELSSYLYKYFFVPLLMPHLILLACTLLQFRLRDKRSIQLLLCIFFAYAMILGGTFILSLTYSKWRSVGGSLERMSLLIVPLILVLLADTVNSVLDRFHEA